MEDAGQQVPDELRAMVRGGGSNYGSSMQFSNGRGGGGNGHYGDGGGNGHYGGGGGGGRGRGVDNRPAWMSETRQGARRRDAVRPAAARGVCGSLAVAVARAAASPFALARPRAAAS